MADLKTTTDRVPVKDQSLGELVATATRDLSVLIHQEMELAKAELAQSAKQGGLGAGMLGAAAFLGLFGAIFLSIAAAYGISWLGIGLGWGFLIVAGVYLVGAGIAGLLGLTTMKKVKGPERAVASVKTDLAMVKHPRTDPADPTGVRATQGEHIRSVAVGD